MPTPASTLQPFNASTAGFPDRLIPLHDGRPGLRATLQITAEPPPVDPQPSTLNSQPVLDFVSSNDTLDRYHEIILPAGWRLDNYRRNPVFQNAHQYGDILFTLGKALITEVRSSECGVRSGGPHLYQRMEFAVDANPIARIAYALYKGKFLNAVSVGFIPLRWLDADGAEHSTISGKDAFHSVPDLSSRQKWDAVECVPTGDGDTDGDAVECVPTSSHSPRSAAAGHSAVRTYVEQELLEVSAVPIPANPNALALAYKSGALEKTDLRETADLLRHLVVADNLQPSILPHRAGRDNLQPLVDLARRLSRLLKQI